MNIAIIGSGNMANGIGTRLITGKHNVTIYDRDLEKASGLAKKLGENAKSKVLGDALDEEVVIFTLPYNAALEVAEKYKDLFKDKIVVDVSNPIDFETYKLIPELGTSGAQEIAKLIPESKVLKAFNTTFAGTLAQGEVGGNMLDVLIAGDDEDSKKILSEIVTTSGLRALDIGALESAHALEELGRLHISLQQKLGNTWMTAVKFIS